MRILSVGLVLALLSGCSPFIYYSPEATAELRSAIAAANEVRVDGPARVKIADRTELFVQQGLVYIPAAPAERLLRAIGMRPVKRTLGVLINATAEQGEVAIVLVRGERIPGVPELEVAGWSAAPELAAFRPR